MVSNKIFEKRAVICFFVIVLLFLSCILRLAALAQSDYGTVSKNQIGYRITVGSLRGTIYDRNMAPLNNKESKLVAAVSPTPEAIMMINSRLEGDEKDRALSELKKEKPVCVEVDEEIECNGITTTTVYTHTSYDTLSKHIIGYTNSENRGVSGIELAFDNVLYSKKTVDAVFEGNAKGKPLYGVEPYFDNDLSVITSGVVTTLDTNIQTISENAAKGILSGAVLVADSKTNEILAMVSKPDFDITDISLSLNASNSPLLNKALASFSVGSVFKPCVAAAGLEQKMGDFCFICEGKTHIIDRDFRCHKLTGHGFMNLNLAIANSCNCYFYNFAQSIKAEPIYKMARNLSFEGSVKIAEGIETAVGIMPKFDMISSNSASLANLSIGQGDLMLSPIALLNLYSAIANDGSYMLPSVVKSLLREGKTESVPKSKKTIAMSEDTAKTLRENLTSVITLGTGTDAKPNLTTAAGKTATAQTGRYDESGTEITNKWFCGFFPAESPKYTIIVMSEGKGEVSAASVFALIADNITDFDKIKQ